MKVITFCAIVGSAALATAGVCNGITSMHSDDVGIVEQYTNKSGNVAKLKSELTTDKFEQLNAAVERKAGDSIRTSLMFKDLVDKMPDCKMLGEAQKTFECLMNVVKAAK